MGPIALLVGTIVAELAKEAVVLATPYVAEKAHDVVDAVAGRVINGAKKE